MTHRVRRTFVGLASAVVAVSSLVSLLPSAISSVTDASVPPRPSVSLLGSVSTVGLPTVPAISRLSVRNDGTDPIRWSIATAVRGAGAPGVNITVWAPVGRGCLAPLGVGSTLDWSSTGLAAGAAAEICVRVLATGTATADVQPTVTVHARAA